MGLFSSKSSRSFSGAWTILVLGLAAAASMSATSAALHPLTQGLRDPELVEIPTYIFLVFICIAIHEFGHVAAGKIAGWRIHSITVGLLSYVPEKRKFVVVKRDALRLFSGFVTATPPPDARWQGAALFILGGCIANFLLAAMTLPFIDQLRKNWDSSTVLPALLGSLAIVSATMGIANLIPFSGFAGLRSDGMRLCELIVRRLSPARRRKRKPA